jgi:hypothetical protein
VAVGSYTLRVDGVERGTVQVAAVPGGTSGELEFRNPAEAGKLPLGFDPRGRSIDVSRGGQSVLAGLFPAQPTGPVDDSGGGGGDDGPGDNGGGGSGGGTTGIWTAPLDNVGPDADANGSLTFEATANEREFEVEAEDLPDGSYTVRVAGTSRATMAVSRGRGEVKFNDPPRAGRQTLDFNPRGATTEIVQGSTVYLRGRLP